VLDEKKEDEIRGDPLEAPEAENKVETNRLNDAREEVAHPARLDDVHGLRGRFRARLLRARSRSFKRRGERSDRWVLVDVCHRQTREPRILPQYRNHARCK
jgi:hypothetical protein